jgi:hypothetical protein
MELTGGEGGSVDQSVHGRMGLDSMQRRNLKDEECFDRELWRKKLCLWVEETSVFTEKFLNI